MGFGRKSISELSTHVSIRQHAASTERWWNKPLVACAGQAQPAEIVILREELQDGERGVWINSRGTASGVIELIRGPSGEYHTQRVRLPGFVSDLLDCIYEKSKVSCGMPDLVIWRESDQSIRFIEVKCPHWDSPSPEQQTILSTIEALGYPASIIEWEFA